MLPMLESLLINSSKFYRALFLLSDKFVIVFLFEFACVIAVHHLLRSVAQLRLLHVFLIKFSLLISFVFFPLLCLCQVNNSTLLFCSLYLLSVSCLLS